MKTTHTTKKLLATLSIAGLALVGCGSSEAEEAPEQTVEQPEAAETQSMPEKPEGVTQEEWDANLEYAESNPDSSPLEVDGPTTYPTNADYYFFGDGRAVGKFTIPTDPSEEVQHVFTSLLPDEQASFVKVTFDNREGESQYTVDNIVGYDEAGKEYKYQDFGATMSEPLWAVWEDIDIFDDAAMAEYDELSALVDKHDNTIPAGAIKDVWLISQQADLPEQLERLGINGGSSYMGGTDPLPAEMAEFDLDFEAPTE